MPIITAIEAQKKGKQRVNIYLDGAFAFSLERGLAQGLVPGQALSGPAVEELIKADRFQQCYAAALRLLGYRPRSLAEMRQRLLHRGFASGAVTEVVSRLQAEGWLSDEAFARFWRESRESFSPRSRRLVAQELRQKGVGAETVSVAIQGMDEAEAAQRAAQKKARTLAGLDAETREQKLAAHLRRRGFGWEAIRQALSRLRHENRVTSADG